MEYTHIFGQLIQRFGLIGALCALAAFLLLIVLAKLGLTKVEILRASYQDRQRERELKLQQETQEKHAMLQELAATRAQVHEFLTNHLAHLKEDSEAQHKHQEQHLLALQAIAHDQTEIKLDLKAHREEEDTRASKVYAKLDEIRLRQEQGPSA